MVLNKDYYLNTDVVFLAKDLIGKVLYTKIDNKITAGIITETEAYAGQIDKASHAYGGRRSKRTEILYHAGGISYVYLIYGMYSLFNIVSNLEDIPHAVLIRGVNIIEGEEFVLSRLNKNNYTSKLTDGPGKLSKAMGIHYSMTGIPLNKTSDLEVQIWIEDQLITIPPNEIKVGPRIGVDYAEEDTLLPYRFLWV